MNDSFTIVELLLAVLILSIVSVFSVPVFIEALNYSKMVEKKTELLLIRATIQENRNKKLMNISLVAYENNLENILTNLNIDSSWIKISDTIYEVNIGDKIVEFQYKKATGQLICQHISQSGCEELNK
ncbi:MAG: hypothetical protein DRG11_05280 [Epsilonproteobacteria bacterium]|nr:MAG: hypothetical protein DRG11_05280 [Campylobacterota bacterium]